MKKNFNLFTLALLMGIRCFGQTNLPTIWERNFGGSNDDRLNNVIATSDGNFLAIGLTQSTNGDQTTTISPTSRYPEVWAIKVNGINGSIIWRKLLSEKSNFLFNPPGYRFPMLELPDGYLIGVNPEAEMFKLNKLSGRLLNSIQIPSYNAELAYLSPNEFYLVAGDNDNNFIDTKLYVIDNATSTILKIIQKPSSLAIWGATQKIKTTPDGGYMLFGLNYKNTSELLCGETTGTNVWVAKLNANLDVLWSKEFGGKTTDSFLDAIVLPNNEFYLLGRTKACEKTGNNIGPNNFGEGTWLIQLDQDGKEISPVRSLAQNAEEIINNIELNCNNEIVRLGINFQNVLFDSPSWNNRYSTTKGENFTGLIRNKINSSYLLYGNAKDASGKLDYYLKLMGPEVNCTAQLDFCSKAITVACGNVYDNQTTVGAENILSSTDYLSCMDSDPRYTFNGPERIYKVVLDKAGDLQVGMEILDKGVDLDLFLLDNYCQVVTCLEKNIEDNSDSVYTYLQKELLAGTYYVVIDGYQSSIQGRFNINFACKYLDCSVPPLLNEGIEYFGNTKNHTNDISIYKPINSAKPRFNVFGPEAIHKISLNSMQEISISFKRSNGNLLLLLLDSSCDKNACVELVQAGLASNTLMKFILGPGDYYLVVDGLLGAAGSYSISYNIDKTTSVTEHPWNSLINVSPNPTSGRFNVTLNLPINALIQPEVINIMGKTITNLPLYQIQRGSFEINLQTFSPGIYFVKLNFSEGSIIKRIVLTQ